MLISQLQLTCQAPSTWPSRAAHLQGTDLEAFAAEEVLLIVDVAVLQAELMCQGSCPRLHHALLIKGVCMQAGKGWGHATPSLWRCSTLMYIVARVMGRSSSSMQQRRVIEQALQSMLETL